MGHVSGSGLQPEKSLFSQSAILCLKELELGLLAVIDADYTLRFIDLKTYRLFGGISLLPAAVSSEYLAVDIAYKGNLALVGRPEGKAADLYHVKTEQTLYTFGMHRGRVSAALFDPTGRYAVTAGEDGKVAAWEIRSGRRAFNLPPHSDEVLAVAFDAAGTYVATGGYDRCVQLSKLHTSKPPKALYGHGSGVNALFFAGTEALVSADREGGIMLWKVGDGSVIKRLEGVEGKVNAMCGDPQGRMLFVGTQQGTVALYDLQTLLQADGRFLKFSHPVTAMHYCSQNGRLAVGTEEGGIHVYALYGNDAMLEDALYAREYATLYAMARENPLVAFSSAYREMEAAWDDALREVDELIAEDRPEDAEYVLGPFRMLKEKRRKLDTVEDELKEYEAFRTHVASNRYPLAYGLAIKYPVFRTSPHYLKMEQEWETSYERAAKLLGKSSTESEGEALLKPFRGISQKAPAIRDLVEEKRRDRYFRELIGKQEWKKVWELVRHNPALKESDAYRGLLNIADKLFISAQKAYSAYDYDTAATVCTVLLDFPDYREDAAALLERMKG
jgi:hypothetical protein